LVGVIDLCSNNSVLPRTPEELRALLDPPGPPVSIASASQPFKLLQRLGEERCAEIVERYEGGETAQVLADEFGVAKSALLILLRSRSVVVRRRSLTDEQVSHLAREYTSGKTIAQLETATGIPHGTIQRALSNAGVKMRPRGFPVR
jgi:hypothetical protein